MINRCLTIIFFTLFLIPVSACWTIIAIGFSIDCYISAFSGFKIIPSPDWHIIRWMTAEYFRFESVVLYFLFSHDVLDLIKRVVEERSVIAFPNVLLLLRSGSEVWARSGVIWIQIPIMLIPIERVSFRLNCLLISIHWYLRTIWLKLLIHSLIIKLLCEIFSNNHIFLNLNEDSLISWIYLTN